MKLLVLTVVLCVAQSQARGQFSLNKKDAHVNAFTNRIIVRNAQVVTTVMDVLQQFKAICDEYGWTNLSQVVTTWINTVGSQSEDTISDIREELVHPPCVPMDTRPECVGYRR